MSVMHMWITLSWKNGVDGNNGGLKDYESVKSSECGSNLLTDDF